MTRVLTHIMKYILLLMLFVSCFGRHSPYRNYNINWLSLIEDPEQLQDARVFYTFFKDSMQKQFEQRQKGKSGFNSGETDFEGFHHPFFYSLNYPTFDENFEKSPI